MLSRKVKRTLIELVNGQILFDEPMKNHTSLRIGGPAEVMIIPKDEYDLKRLLSFVGKESIQLTVVGNGTKLLVSDRGIQGVTVKISGCLNDVKISGTVIEVGAGHSLAKLSRLVINHGLSGLEFAVGIPGTVGGGVVMNAGAHGSAMSDVVTSITVITYKGEIKEYSRSKLGFGYRQSKLQNSPLIVLMVEMDLEKSDINNVKEKMSRNIQWRIRNQPLNFPNAGSIFKNPTGLIAGKLIDKAGLKGLTIGDAKLSEKRANFAINLGNATASDMLKLMQMTQKKVFENFHVKLEPEIRAIGFRLNQVRLQQDNGVAIEN